MSHFLFELGCEELPPSCQLPLVNEMAESFGQLLQEQQIAFEDIEVFSTPRRLAFIAKNIATMQPDRPLEKKGPSIKAAFDQDGKPTKALLGFCQSLDVDMKQLETISTEKGDWLQYRGTKAGEKTEVLLPSILTTMLEKLPLSKPMLWAKDVPAFVRPVRWAVAILGSKLIKTTCFGVKTSKKSRGHTTHHPEAITIEKASDYVETLRSVKVIASFQARQKLIMSEVKKLENDVMNAHLDPELLDEVTNLVEWPRAHLGHFDAEYLTLPSEVLITAMKKHQRYFSLHDQQGKIQPAFITIANIVSQDKKRLIQGYERVLSARLADAHFFYQKDSQTSPAVFLEQEKRVTFQQGLGSLYDKTMRIHKLAASLAGSLGVDNIDAQEAAKLCKFDLMTDMVDEFTNLQGIMGGYYANQHGVAREICTAIQEHYRPTHAGDALPSSRLGTLIALADKVDTLIGLFSINKIPSGTKDPFSLRRHAQGVIRILVETQLDFDINSLVKQANQLLPNPANQTLVDQCVTFCMERFRQQLLDQGTHVDEVEALFLTGSTHPYDLTLRLQALQAFMQQPEATSLTTACKRIDNILKKNLTDNSKVAKSLLQEPKEKALFAALTPLKKEVPILIKDRDYKAALTALARLKNPVDAFFETTLVMADDSKVRGNRLALLHQLAQLCNSVVIMRALTER